jgi:hypothetical protein
MIIVDWPPSGCNNENIKPYEYTFAELNDIDNVGEYVYVREKGGMYSYKFIFDFDCYKLMKDDGVYVLEASYGYYSDGRIYNVEMDSNGSVVKAANRPGYPLVPDNVDIQVLGTIPYTSHSDSLK